MAVMTFPEFVGKVAGGLNERHLDGPLGHAYAPPNVVYPGTPQEVVFDSKFPVANVTLSGGPGIFNHPSRSGSGHFV